MFRVKRCGVCGGKVKVVNLPYMPRLRPEVGLVVFGDVPAQECMECGEKFFPSEVALAMEKVLRERVQASQTLEVPFFSLRNQTMTKKRRKRAAPVRQ